MKKRITAESIFDIYNIESPAVSPDSSLIAFVRSRPSESADDYEKSIWLADTAGEAEPVQFISTGRKNYSPAWSPDGQKLCFVSQRDGSAQLYEIPADGGEARKLTSMVGSVGNPAYSPDGKRIVFNSDSTVDEHALEDSGVLYGDVTGEYARKWSENHRKSLKDPRVIEKLPYKTGTSFFDGRYSHLYVYECESGRVKRLSNGNYHHSAGQWSADSARVFANSNRDQKSGDEFFELWSSILSFDVRTAKMTEVAAEVCEEGRPPRISPDGKWVAFFYVPKSSSPYQLPYYVAVAPVDGGEIRPITSDDMTVADFQWDTDSAHILVNLHWHGDAVVKRVSINDPAGDITTVLDGKRFVGDFQISKDGTLLAYNVTTPVKPSDLQVYFRQQDREIQLTHFNEKWEKEHFLSPYNEIEYTAPDGTQLQGWYCKPMNFDSAQSYPLAVEIHGGPQVMWGLSFMHEFQMLASHGYFVFFCNPRGSAGYGRHFQEIRENGGYTDMPDIMQGMDEVLKQEPAIDKEKLVCTGGSYGGFLSGWIVTHTDRFKAVVSQRGVYDELNMFGSGDIPESVEWYFNGVPRTETLSEVWDHSPIAHAKKVTTPLMILHSELDFRVPVSQAETFFAHLRRQGKKDTVMVRYPNEGHELSRSGGPRHRVDRLYKIMGWFDLHVNKSEKELSIAVDSWLNKGWEVHDGAFVKHFDTGTYPIGAQLLEEFVSLLKRYGVEPVFNLSEKTLTVTLQGIEWNNMKFILRAERFLAGA